MVFTAPLACHRCLLFLDNAAPFARGGDHLWDPTPILQGTEKIVQIAYDIVKPPFHSGSDAVCAFQTSEKLCHVGIGAVFVLRKQRLEKSNVGLQTALLLR